MYYAYGIIKVKYLESLLTILFVRLLFFFYNDYNNKMYLILYIYIHINVHINDVLEIQYDEIIK